MSYNSLDSRGINIRLAKLAEKRPDLLASLLLSWLDEDETRGGGAKLLEKQQRKGDNRVN